MTATAAARPPRRLLPLPPGALSLWTAVLTIAASAAVAAAFRGRPDGDAWEVFVLLSSAAALAQLFVVRTGVNQAFHTALVFVTAGALLLPPQLVVLMAVVQHIPEWIKERYPVYIQTFNIGNFALDGLAGWSAAHAVRAALPDGSDFGWALAGGAAAVTIIVLNHVVLASMLRLARGRSLRESELFGAYALGLDFVLGLLGVTVALCWRSNPWVIPTLIAPLVAAQGGFAMIGKLRESEQRFRAMFEAAPFGVKLTDLDGNLVEANAALEHMLGYSSEELTALPPEVVQDGERRYNASDGREVLARVAVAPVPDADGRPKYRLALIEDVTRRAELEEQLRQAQRLEGLGRLAGGVAHDFNNLLTAISGYAEIALSRVPEGEDDTRSDLQEISRASGRAAELTSQLLAFGRKQMLQPKDVNLNELVANIHNMLHRVIGEDVELGAVFHGPDAPRVHADPGQLEQVIMNLVVNARDAMPGGGTITIETSNVTIDEDSPLCVEDGAAPGPHSLVAVRDTGEGIPAEHLGRIFDPFFTTKEIGKGTGLGLATVYGIVRQSGGFITVTSAPGRGSVFSVYLPRVGDPLGDDAPGDDDAAEPKRGSERVLLVEDEPVVRELVSRMLRTHGYEVISAENGPAALELAKSDPGRIDVLMTDVVMPRMSGPELAAQMREHHPEARVLYTSGYADTDLMGRGLEGDDSDFLQKPFGVTELTQKIHTLVGRS